jgi:hypothetical protein
VPNTRPPPTEDDPDLEERADVDMDVKELETTEKDFNDMKTDKANVKTDAKPAAHPEDKKNDENAKDLGNKKIDIDVGIKVKQPKVKDAKVEPEQPSTEVSKLGKMEEGEDVALFPVRKLFSLSGSSHSSLILCLPKS